MKKIEGVGGGVWVWGGGYLPAPPLPPSLSGWSFFLFFLLWSFSKKRRVWVWGGRELLPPQTPNPSAASSLKEKPPKGYMWSGWRLTKIQTSNWPYHVRPEVWTPIGKVAQNREKQERKTRSQNSTMFDDWEEFTLLILMAKITKEHSQMRW